MKKELVVSAFLCRTLDDLIRLLVPYDFPVCIRYRTRLTVPRRRLTYHPNHLERCVRVGSSFSRVKICQLAVMRYLRNRH